MNKIVSNVDEIVSEICDFVSYVDSFYNAKSGIYPIKGMTNRMVLNATKKYIASLNDEMTWGGGDSLDRERVRDIILEDNRLEWIN
jgi:hypothetical protein